MPIFPSDIQNSYIVTLPFETRKLLEGNVFSSSRYVESVADTASIDLLLSLTDKQFRILLDGIAYGDSLLYLYEDTTVSNSGTPLSVNNHLRTSTKVFPGTISHTPTITSVGTLLLGPIYLAGGTGNRRGGSTGEGCEAILSKLNTNYLARLTNISSAASKMMLGIHGCFPTL